MIVTVVLENEYGQYEERINFFLEAASFAQKEDVFIIANEGLYKRYEQLLDNLPRRFFDEFEIGEISKEDIEKLDVYCIPDLYFDGKIRDAGTKSKSLVELYNECDNELKNTLISVISEELKKRGIDHIDYFMNNMEVMRTVAEVAKHFGAPVIPYVFSPIRKVHGYGQTLYVSHMDSKLYSSKKAENMYDEFVASVPEEKLLTRKEILALIGKKRNFKLIPYVGMAGNKEIGFIAGGRHILPVVYQYDYTTDDDVNYVLTKNYTRDQISVRMHPIQLDFCGFGRAHMQNDPVSFILEAKKLITVQSQLMVKAALWGKPVVSLGRGLPYSFLFGRDIEEAYVLSELDLNFLLFCYLVPSNCMWNRSYWLWRIKENPSPIELYKRHINAIIEYLGFPSDSLLCEGKLGRFLSNRGMEESDIEDVLRGTQVELEFPFLLARAACESCNGEEKTVYSVNKRTSKNQLKTVFEVKDVNELEEIRLYLLDDIDGYVRIIQLTIDGVEEKVECENEKYYSKGECTIVLPGKELENKEFSELEVIWEARKYE